MELLPWSVPSDFYQAEMLAKLSAADQSLLNSAYKIKPSNREILSASNSASQKARKLLKS